MLRLKFLPERKGQPPLLVSVGREGKTMAVRLWDAAAGRLLAERTDLPDPGGNEPPGLEAWYTGPKVKDVGVAVALARDFGRGKEAPPGRLNYWDAGKDRLFSTPLDPSWQFTCTAAFRPGKSPDEGVLFAGGLWLKKGDATNGSYVQTWPLAADGPRKDSDRTEFLNKGALRSLILLPATDGGPSDLAAAVEEFPGQAPPYRLVMIARTAAGGFGVVKASVPLWKTAGPVAVTAASPDGARLAVSGGADHEVWIYSREDLLKGKNEPLQKLGSAGAHVAGVAFVRKAGAPGLLLRQDKTGGGEAGEWVLDPDGHGLRQGRDGWNDDGPDLDGWKVVPGDGNVFTVEKDGVKVGAVHLGLGQPATFRPLLPCFALLPPCKPLDKPLLAVGYVEQGVSYLELFDVVADRRLRRFSGHVNVVRALAFSKDGRLLASAAEDQTVAVWGLTDLDKVIGRAGAVPGLVVEEKEGKVVLASADAAALSAVNRQALADQKVGAGAVVEGVVKGKALQAFRSPQDVYDAAWDVKPGDSIVLRIGGKDVSLQVDQGEDERKPLFTFFMRDEARDRLWLAWTPVGPYDTDDRVRAEGVIGWQSNTGKASAPVEFSPAAQYRKESYRPGLLKHLFAAANLSGALKKWNDEPAPKPGMGLRLVAPKTQFPHDAGGRVVVQGPPPGQTLRAELYDILAAKVRRARWRFDDGDWRDFDGQSELTFTANLDKAGLDWRGHTHEFALLVETVEATPTQYTRRLPVYFAPPRPEIASDLGAATEVAAADFTFRAAAVAGKHGPAAVPVRTTVRLNDGAPKTAGAKIDETFHLAEGDNFIEVRAENEGAAPEFAAEETATRRWKVRYTPPKKVAPPTVYFESVTSAADRPQDGKPLVVHARTVHVRGRITSAEPIVEASCDGRRLAALAAANADRLNLPIDEPITLKTAGQEQTVKFVARHAKGDPTTKSVVLKYEPPAPHFEFDPDAPGPAVAADGEKAALRGRVVKAEDDPSEFKVEVYLNGRPVAGVEVKEDRLTAPLSLRPGDNGIDVVLSNPFDRRTATAHCYRRRPPLVKSLESAEAAGNPLAKLTALVDSPADRPLSGVRVVSDAVADLAPRVTLTKQGPPANGGAVQTWKVVVADVLLKDGKKNRLSLWARNEDGESAAPAETVVVRKERPAPRPPVVEVLTPRLTEEVVETPRTRLAFRVRWRGSVGEVAVLVNDKPLAEAGLTTPAAPDADGAVTYRTDALPLQSGPNLIRVVAVNRGGLGQSDSYTLFYRRRTTIIRLTGLSAGKRSAAPDNPLFQGDRIRFPRQDQAEVWVHGEVEWPYETDPVLTQDRPAARARVGERFRTVRGAAGGAVPRRPGPPLRGRAPAQQCEQPCGNRLFRREGGEGGLRRTLFAAGPRPAPTSAGGGARPPRRGGGEWAGVDGVSGPAHRRRPFRHGGLPRRPAVRAGRQAGPARGGLRRG